MPPWAKSIWSISGGKPSPGMGGPGGPIPIPGGIWPGGAPLGGAGICWCIGIGMAGSLSKGVEKGRFFLGLVRLEPLHLC